MTSQWDTPSTFDAQQRTQNASNLAHVARATQKADRGKTHAMIISYLSLAVAVAAVAISALKP